MSSHREQYFGYIKKFYNDLPFSSHVSQFFSALAPIIQNLQLIISRVRSDCWECVITQKSNILIPISLISIVANIKKLMLFYFYKIEFFMKEDGSISNIPSKTITE